MTQVAPGLATASDPLPLPKATYLGFAWAGERAWTVLEEMLTPHAYGAQILLMISFHALDP
jgi:hypothetical protein